MVWCPQSPNVFAAPKRDTPSAVLVTENVKTSLPRRASKRPRGGRKSLTNFLGIYLPPRFWLFCHVNLKKAFKVWNAGTGHGEYHFSVDSHIFFLIIANDIINSPGLQYMAISCAISFFPDARSFGAGNRSCNRLKNPDVSSNSHEWRVHFHKIPYRLLSLQ